MWSTDLVNPLVEGGVLEHAIEFFLHDHVILSLDVVHVDEQVEILGLASEKWPEVDVAP